MFGRKKKKDDESIGSRQTEDMPLVTEAVEVDEIEVLPPPRVPEQLKHFEVISEIGKGGMGDSTLEALKKHKVVYVSFTGGAGALAAKGLGKVKAVHFLEELGMAEAVWVFETNNFGPLIVSMDHHGHSLYKNVDRETEENLARLLND